MQQHYSLAVIGNVNVQPVTLAEARSWLRVDDSNDDTMINRLIQAARQRCEAFTGRSFALTQYQMTLDHFPLLPGMVYGPGTSNMMVPATYSQWIVDSSAWAIRIPRCPLIAPASSDVVITYVDTNGNTQTLDPSQYIVDADSEPGRITTSQGGFWPATLFQPKAVTVQFTAGYASAAIVPPLAGVAILELASFYYSNRGEMDADLPAGVESLLYPLKVFA